MQVDTFESDTSLEFKLVLLKFVCTLKLSLNRFWNLRILFLFFKWKSVKLRAYLYNDFVKHLHVFSFVFQFWTTYAFMKRISRAAKSYFAIISLELISKRRNRHYLDNCCYYFFDLCFRCWGRAMNSIRAWSMLMNLRKTEGNLNEFIFSRQSYDVRKYAICVTVTQIFHGKALKFHL